VGSSGLQRRTGLGQGGQLRRTALGRGTGGLHRTSGLCQASGRPKASSKKRTAKKDIPDLSAFSAAVIAAALTRSHGWCERCGSGLGPIRGDHWHAHHRVLRGMGGSQLAQLGEVSNCAVLCASCHDWVHGTNNRTEAEASGWIVSRYQDPAAIPMLVQLPGRSRRVRRLLTSDGGYGQVAA
jgi:hypothetical protein